MFNTGIKNDELERLAILAEECAEVIQVVNKTIRHGYTSYNPNDLNMTTNRELLEREIGDLECIIEMLKVAGDVDYELITKHKNRKSDRIINYLHFQKTE